MSGIQKNTFGSVRPYTRHVNGCSRTDNKCKCPKWLYENRRGCEPRRYTLNTPSWAEAQKIAADKLRSFDPEIAAARAVTEKRDAALVTVADAGERWMQRTRTELGNDAGGLPQYKSLIRMFESWARRDGIEYVQDITALQLGNWYAPKDWTRLADTTRNRRWGVMRSMFRHWQGLGILSENPIANIKASKVDKEQVQGPYTQEQVDAIFASIEQTAVKISREELSVYAPRQSRSRNSCL